MREAPSSAFRALTLLVGLGCTNCLLLSADAAQCLYWCDTGWRGGSLPTTTSSQKHPSSTSENPCQLVSAYRHPSSLFDNDRQRMSAVGNDSRRQVVGGCQTPRWRDGDPGLVCYENRWEFLIICPPILALLDGLVTTTTTTKLEECRSPDELDPTSCSWGLV